MGLEDYVAAADRGRAQQADLAIQLWDELRAAVADFIRIARERRIAPYRTMPPLRATDGSVDRKPMSGWCVTREVEALWIAGDGGLYREWIENEASETLMVRVNSLNSTGINNAGQLDEAMKIMAQFVSK